jgi:hypothetical protein
MGPVWLQDSEGVDQRRYQDGWETIVRRVIAVPGDDPSEVPALYRAEFLARAREPLGVALVNQAIADLARDGIGQERLARLLARRLNCRVMLAQQQGQAELITVAFGEEKPERIGNVMDKAAE